MDCNKDEALRAKELAEKKMLNNDFEGAKKVAVKAEQLYPQLENISQLLSVCDVHCSAQNNRAGSEKDWYGILQIDRLADETTIKKQYRRLALVLHPDKNKLPGAEAAFKLIVEANMVLSDPVKRSAYDNKYRLYSKPAGARQPPHQVNRNPFVRQNNIHNGYAPPFSNLNHHQHTQPASSGKQETFWTQCPYCRVRYQYFSNYMNSALRCQKCEKPFIAYDLGSQGAPTEWCQPGGQDVPLKSNLNQPFEKKELPKQGTSKMAAGSTGFPPTQTGSRPGLSSRTARSEPEICRGKTAPVFEDIRTKGKDEKLTGGVRKGAAMPKVDRKSRKRSRKQTVESSESNDTSTSVAVEDLDIENGNSPLGTRRSARHRQRVLYSEGASDDENDLASPLKKARPNQSGADSKPQQQEAVGGDDQKHVGATRSCSNSVEGLNQNGVRLPEGDVRNNDSKIGTVKEQASRPPSGGVERVDLVDSDSESGTIPGSHPPEMYDYPDPEFSDFDKHKAENCFAADQIWACYDTADGMPRFYAHIRKVSSPEFNIMFSWLESHPEDKRGTAWVEADLPIGCGKFRRGSSEDTSDRLIFSHQVQCEMGKRGLYSVYPRKGETWALFKDWDFSWSSNPDNHRKYKYEVVEILSDYAGDVGVQVSYLDKVTGFVSLFHRTRPSKVGTFFVKPKELYKFSHRIPSFKMTGTEREDVPVGSFELDPASLPLNPDDIWYPGKAKEDSRTENSEPVENVSSTVPPGTRDKSRMSENASSSLKSVDLKGIHATDGESAKVRRSPRGVNVSENKQSKVSSPSANGSPSTEFDDNCVKKGGCSSPSIPSHFSCQADEELHSRTKSSGVSNFSGSSENPITLPDDKGFEDVFCDFRMDITLEKFQLDQVWALYQNNLPKTYAQIKKIVPSQFKLHVALLEACAGPKSAAPAVCGTFKVQNLKRRIFDPSAFSHVVKAVSITKNRFEIYPREGEIWALYKNWKKSGLETEYEIAEVIEYSKDLIKVSSMVRVDGFKSVFKSPKKQRSNSVILEIPKDELGRFSHQIPAFQLTGEKGGALRGYWELDPASVPYPL